MTEEKKIEILYDHYKDTFENQKAYIQKRNNYTIICLLLFTSLSFQLVNPVQSTLISNEVLKKNIGDIKIDFGYINNILTFSLLWIMTMYYQINVLIDKNYKYIRNIENGLSEEMAPLEIAREGKNYLHNYPVLSMVVHRFYSIGFPVVFIVLAIVKWLAEKRNLVCPWDSKHFIIDTALLISICVASLLYLSHRHFNDFKKQVKDIEP